jgi:hypothetical protein
VVFSAHDILNASTIISSNMVLINITNISHSSSTPIEIPVNTQSTGGGTNTQPTPIPIPEEVEKPRPLQIITPSMVTTYKNATIKVPLIINNTWNETLVGITLEAQTNASNVTLYLDRIFIPKLSNGESVEANLYIRNYKSEGHYEIKIIGNVSLPSYQDTATIYINSAEMKSEGDELESKISFARDLLSSNPECQELTELLVEAKKKLADSNYLDGAKIVDNVINGCKYLVNNAKKNTESPNGDFLKTFEWKRAYTDYAIIGVFAILFLIALYYLIHRDSSDNI